MQYLLTPEEYEALKNAGANEKTRLEAVLQDLCTKVADHMPVAGYPREGKPWGCIKTVKHEWYCDQCPVRQVCPNQWKEWSK